MGADLALPHFPARAKRVIFLLMAGGPSHLDMLDPKPAIKQHAGKRPGGVDLRTERVTGGLLPSPFAFQKCGESGIEVSELLPHLRGCVDDLCVLRAVHGSNPNHGPATNFLISGAHRPGPPEPGRVDLVRPGDREPEPARVRLAGAIPSRPQRGTATCPASTRGRRSSWTGRAPTG